MAYNKYTWVDGELITAEKLNHMEDGIAEGGGCDCGFECTETTEQLFNETVTTVEHDGVCFAQLNYLGLITADELTVIFNGTQYICPKIIVNGADGAYYGGVNPSTGAPDFTDFPFSISAIDVNANMLVTETAGTYTLEVKAQTTTLTTTPCFEKAVCESVLYVVESYVNPAQEAVLTKTWQEIYDAAETKVVLLRRRGGSQILFDYLTYLEETSDSYSLTFGGAGTYNADSKDDYPVKGGK